MKPSRYRALLVDMDGVLWRGREPIEENLRALRSLNLPMVFLTNNSTTSRARYLERLHALGLKVPETHVLTSGYAAALWLKRRGILQTFVIGEEGITQELQGLQIHYETDPEVVLEGRYQPEAVVVGLDRGVSYRKLWAGQRCILNGALFVATNTDATYPTETGPAPGAGAMVSALQTATGREPHVVIGKPQPQMFRLALEILKVEPEQALVIGDRWDTDIVGARRLKIPALLVLTGVTSADEVPQGTDGVTVVKDLTTWLQQAS